MELTALQNRFLTEQRVARLASRNPDGTTHLVPVCFVHQHGTVFSTVMVGSKRVLNIAKNPRVSMTVDQYDEKAGEWVVLKGVLMYGAARLLTYDAQRNRFMMGWQGLIGKYPQYRRWAKADLSPTDQSRRRIMEFTPEKVVSWGLE